MAPSEPEQRDNPLKPTLHGYDTILALSFTTNQDIGEQDDTRREASNSLEAWLDEARRCRLAEVTVHGLQHNELATKRQNGPKSIITVSRALEIAIGEVSHDDGDPQMDKACAHIGRRARHAMLHPSQDRVSAMALVQMMEGDLQLLLEIGKRPEDGDRIRKNILRKAMKYKALAEESGMEDEIVNDITFSEDDGEVNPARLGYTLNRIMSKLDMPHNDRFGSEIHDLLSCGEVLQQGGTIK